MGKDAGNVVNPHPTLELFLPQGPSRARQIQGQQPLQNTSGCREHQARADVHHPHARLRRRITSSLPIPADGGQEISARRVPFHQRVRSCLRSGLRMRAVVAHCGTGHQGALHAVGRQLRQGPGQQPGAANPALVDGFLVGVGEPPPNGVPGNVHHRLTLRQSCRIKQTGVGIPKNLIGRLRRPADQFQHGVSAAAQQCAHLPANQARCPGDGNRQRPGRVVVVEGQVRQQLSSSKRKHALKLCIHSLVGPLAASQRGQLVMHLVHHDSGARLRPIAEFVGVRPRRQRPLVHDVGKAGSGHQDRVQGIPSQLRLRPTLSRQRGREHAAHAACGRSQPHPHAAGGTHAHGRRRADIDAVAGFGQDGPKERRREPHQRAWPGEPVKHLLAWKGNGCGAVKNGHGNLQSGFDYHPAPWRGQSVSATC